MIDRASIEHYITHLSKERRLSPHTASNYARDLRALAEFAVKNDVRDWKSLDSQHVRVFAARSHASGLAVRGARLLQLPRA
jgi:integrase/recombinase XerC